MFAQTYKYYTATSNFITLSASGCYQSNPLSEPYTQGSIKIIDVNNNQLSNVAGTFEFDVQPKNYVVSFGSCRWLEGFNTGGTYSLGGYDINIGSSLDSYYELKKGGNGVFFGALFFEKRNLNEVNEINCNGLNLNTISSVSSSDVIEWQYSFEGSLQTIANSQGKASMNVDFNNFSVNFSENIGKTIFFRYKLLGDVFSPLKAYTIVACSPQLEKPVKTKPTTCSYSVDGGFTLNFKRDLNVNETLVITLYDGDNEAVLFNQEFTDTLINNGDGTFGYTWQALLDAGNYKVKFQTHNENEGIDKNDASWDSLEFSDSFTISKPDKVSFSITNTSDKTCFNTNDGYIDVNATGEDNRTFLYQLTKDEVIQIFNGTSWINYTGVNIDNETWYNFTNAETTRISNLAKGTYRVKVRDSKGCFERQN
jgi:hypothetical protein